MSTNGEIQRAQLFKDVDDLLEWKKSFELKQHHLIQWQERVTKRIDIVNKRLRKLEQKL